MKIRTLQVSVIFAVAISMSLPAWGRQYLLYEPRPVTSGQSVTPEEGILVQEVEVKKGDTMYDISRKFSGRGMYYPQILLFNTIKNPRLIYPGDILKIPVSRRNVPVTKHHADSAHEAASRDTGPAGLPSRVGSEAKIPSLPAAETPVEKGTPGESAASDLNNQKTERKRTLRGKGAADSGKVPAKQGSSSPSSRKKGSAVQSKGDVVKSQELFEHAVKAYRQDDCRTALELFDRYLAGNSDSPLAADANLYKAECYMKLSTQ